MSKLISLKQFIKKYNGKSVDVPWGYKGECVSLIQRYLNECYGVEMKARGNAKDWQNSILREGLGVTTNYPVRGDIVIWGAEAGDGMGHIAIYLDEKYDFDQNKGGDRITGIKTRRGGKIMAYMHITPLKRPADEPDNKPDEKPSTDGYKVGDKVIVNGYLYKTAAASVKGSADHSNKEAVIDIIAKTGDAKFHVKGSGVDGWAKASQIKKDGGKPEEPKRKTNEEIAAEVKLGKWGNGAERKKRLTEAGYNYDDIQAIVNESSPKPTPIKKGDKVQVINPIQYTGGRFNVYHKDYDVLEVKGDRAVIGKGKTITAAINVINLRKV